MLQHSDLSGHSSKTTCLLHIKPSSKYILYDPPNWNTLWFSFTNSLVTPINLEKKCCNRPQSPLQEKNRYSVFLKVHLYVQVSPMVCGYAQVFQRCAGTCTHRGTRKCFQRCADKHRSFRWFVGTQSV